MDASPKRRALAALNPNASSPKPYLGLKPGHARQGSPLKQRPMTIPVLSPEPSKRVVVMDENREEHPAKKARVEGFDESETQPRSVPSSQNTNMESPQPSPAASSVFDCSMLDTSQATTLTEPDAGPAVPTVAISSASRRSIPVPPPAHPKMTREQAREKAEILRLRLGLASYKLKTGQADVPLDRLQMRPLPGARRVPGLALGQVARPRSETVVHAPQETRRPLPARRASQEELVQERVKQEVDADVQQTDDQEGQTSQDSARNVEIEIIEHPAPEPSELPRLSRPDGINTPRRHSHLDVERDSERLTSSAIRGGVANVMLSLSRS